MELNTWINKNYKDLRDTLKNIMKDEQHLVDDLLHELLLEFIQKPVAQKVVDDGVAKFYIIRMALNQYKSSSSPFYKKYKKHINNNERYLSNEWWESITDTNEYNIELDRLINLNLDIIEELLLSDDIKEKNAAFTIMLWYSNDMNFAEVARCLKVSRSTYRRQFDNATKIVIQKIKGRDTNITYNQLPLKIFTTKLLKGYGKKRRY